MLEYWFMFPVAIVVASIAMTLGVGRALFFSPIIIIAFPLINPELAISPADAFGAALLTEVFGFTSGLYGYARKKLIDYKTAVGLLIISIPSAILGTIVKRVIAQFELGEFLNLFFGIGLWILALYVLLNQHKEKKGPPKPTERSPHRLIIDNESHTYEYKVCNANQGRILNGIGGFAAGLISVGIGETVMTTLRVRCGLPMKIAAGTSVLIVTITVFSAALTDVLMIGLESVPWTLIMFTIPGVLIGGQIGPRIASKVTSKQAEWLMIGVFWFFGSIMIIKALLGIF